MVQTLRTTGFILLVAGLSSPAFGSPTSGSGKAVDGRYEGGLGVLEFNTDGGGRIVGRYGEGGACNFDLRRPIVDGELEGNVFVGTVTLCQEGPACEERAYPVLAFVSPDGTLAADVKLEPGCKSNALTGTRLLLKSSPGGVVLASAKRPRARKKREECIDALKRGTVLLQKRDYAGASYYFAEGLECNADNWPAYLGIGIAELRRGRVEEAMTAFHRAQKLAKAGGEEDAGIYFNLACGYARMGDRPKALAALGRSVKLGWADPKAMVDDPDLAPLRDEPQFKTLVDQAWDLKQNQPEQ